MSALQSGICVGDVVNLTTGDVLPGASGVAVNVHDRYRVMVQDVTVLTDVPSWVVQSEFPCIGGIYLGKFYWLSHEHGMFFDRKATKHNQGLRIDTDYRPGSRVPRKPRPA